MARLCKKKRRKVLKHVFQRGDERYGGISQEQLEQLHAAHRDGSSINVGRAEYVNWLLDGRCVRYIYRRGVGVTTVLPLRGDEIIRVFRAIGLD